MTRFLLPVLFLCGTRALSYRKCCSLDERLTIDRTSCIPKSNKDTQNLEDALKTIAQDSGVVSFNLETVGFPSCSATEAFLLSRDKTSVNRLTPEGGLVTTKYRMPVSSQQFCLDLSENQQVYAVTCDQCKSGRLCVNLCCPFGYIIDDSLPLYDYEEGTDSSPNPIGDEKDTKFPAIRRTKRENTENLELAEPNPCIKIDANPQLNLDFWKNETVFLDNWKEGDNYILVGPSVQFKCPLNLVTGQPAPLLQNIKPVNGTPPKLMASGHLMGVGEENLRSTRDDRVIGQIKRSNKGPAEFCVSLLSDDKGQYSELAELFYGVCQTEEQPDYCESVRRVLFNIAFIVSLVFIMLALLAHTVESQLRDSSFGKITVGYLVNFFIYLFILVHERHMNYSQGTVPCEVVGYLLQYFYLAFFAWLNAMSMFFCKTLGTLKMPTSKSIDKFLIFAVSYAQGLPLLICLTTYGMDKRRKTLGDAVEKHWLYPRMGEFGCYVGFLNDKRHTVHYLESPEFIYIQSFQLIMLLSNLVMWALCARTILRTRLVRATISSENAAAKLRKENFFILMKLFVYMVSAWILEILTSAIATEKGIRQSCEVRMVLDIPNSLYGLFIFLILVCSKSMVRLSLKKKVTSVFTSSTTPDTPISLSPAPLTHNTHTAPLTHNTHNG